MSGTRHLPWRVHLTDIVLNTAAVLLLAGGLFWLQPAVLSAPFDGVFTYLNMVQTFQWQPPGQLLGGYYPLEGLGSRLMPSVPLLQPHLLSYWLVSEPGTRVWLTYLILAGLLAAASLAYYRTIGVSRGVSIAASWLNVVLAVPGSDLAHATWGVLAAQAALLTALAIFQPIGARAGPDVRPTPDGRAHLRNALWAVAFAAFVVLMILADHVFTGYLAGPILGVALLVGAVMAPTRTERFWKLSTLAVAGIIVLALGIPQWMLALAGSISRAVFFDEILAQPQYARNAGLLFRSSNDFTLVYVLAIFGVVGDLACGDRTRRTLAAILALLSVGLAAAGLVFLTTDLRWRGPAPAYFNIFLFPWLALAAIRGLGRIGAWTGSWLDRTRPTVAIQSGGSRLRWPGVAVALTAVFLAAKLMTGTATLLTIFLVAVVMGVAGLAAVAKQWMSPVVLAEPSKSAPSERSTAVALWKRAMPLVWALVVLLALFNGEVVRLDWWRGGVQVPGDDGRNGVQQVFATLPPFTRFLKDRLGVTPGSPFRGYADSLVVRQRMPLAVPLEILAWHAQDIPTISQYTYYLTPEMHALATRFLAFPVDYRNVNHLALSQVDVRIMRMLGLRYLMVRDPQEFPGLNRADRQGEYRLWEVPDPNLASFSPTRVRLAPDAAGLLDLLANPSFDPKADAVISEADAAAGDLRGDAQGDLVPATGTGLTFEQGGFRFTAQSGGRSLVVLPVQFTRCLDLVTVRGTAAQAARVVRVNLVETGVIFTGDVEIEGRYRSSGPWERCIRDDVADTAQLRTAALVQRVRVPEYSHPGSRLPIFAPFGLD